MEDKKRLYRSMIFPFFMLALMWLIKLTEYFFKLDFSGFGIKPLDLYGLIGIVTSPLLHADFPHLLANSIPFFVSASIIFYFYREVAFGVFFLAWGITGLWVWSFARGGVHIGASGIVYAYLSFLFFSGIIRRNARLMAISLLVIFLYGGLLWGIFPNFFPERNISWESHLMGGVAGLVLAIFFRNKGIQKEQYQWDEDDETSDEYSEDQDQLPQGPPEKPQA